MKSQIKIAFLSLICITWCAGRTLADYVVSSNLTGAQEQSNAWSAIGLISPADNINNSRMGQSFVSQQDGFLTTIDALVSAGFNGIVPGSPPLNLSVYSSSNGIPDTVLGTLTFPASGFPNISTFVSHRRTFDFGSFQIMLHMGQEYFLAFETAFGVQSGPPFFNSPFYAGLSWSSIDGDHSLSLGRNLTQALDGNTWVVNQTYRELGIVVRAVPEPSAMLLAATGFAALIARRRKSVPPQSRLTSAGGSG